MWQQWSRKNVWTSMRLFSRSFVVIFSFFTFFALITRTIHENAPRSPWSKIRKKALTNFENRVSSRYTLSHYCGSSGLSAPKLLWRETKIIASGVRIEQYIGKKMLRLFSESSSFSFVCNFVVASPQVSRRKYIAYTVIQLSRERKFEICTLGDFLFLPKMVSASLKG